MADRESDMMDIIEQGHQHNHPADYLLRARHNRVLEDEGKLFDLIDKHCLGELQFKMPTRQGESGRSVTQAIYVRHVTLKKGIPLTLIVAKETKPPKGKKAIEWKLITNRTIESFDGVTTMIDYYRKRWQIEVLCHVLKSGCKIEERQFGCIETHERALLLYLLVSYRILLMTMLAKADPKACCELVFTRQEGQTAYRVRYRKKPPKQPISLDEMVRVVAGFGGFLNRKSDKSPGVKTVWLGLRSLADYLVGASCG